MNPRSPVAAKNTESWLELAIANCKVEGEIVPDPN
jgi:hypothetical protein